MRRWPAPLLLLVAGVVGAAEPTPVQLRTAPYLGVDNAVFLEAPGPDVTAVVTPRVGGRIAHYGMGDTNLMWDIPGPGGRPSPGGYQCDVGPEMRLIPSHPVLWSEPYAWRPLDEAGLALSSAEDPVLGLALERDVTMDPASGALDVVQRLRNATPGEKSYCLWDRTLCRAGGFTLIPLNESSRFPTGWVLGRRARGAWDYDGLAPSHPSVRVMDGVLVVRSAGPEQKVGADSDAGWIAYVLGDLLLVKYYAYDPRGRYTDGGLSVAHYYNETLAELEPISPEVTLSEGESYAFPERWTLRRLASPVTTHEQARALVTAIPPSPFARR